MGLVLSLLTQQSLLSQRCFQQNNQLFTLVTLGLHDMPILLLVQPINAEGSLSAIWLLWSNLNFLLWLLPITNLGEPVKGLPIS